MNGHTNIIGKYYRLRSKAWRNMRYMFPSPAEVKFIRIMGGRAISVPFFKHPKTGFSYTYIISMGKILNSELIKREVRVGKYWVDFGNDIKRGIEIDGQKYHNDIVAQQERDDYFAGFDWRVLHIRAADLWRQPDNVQRDVIAFLAS